MVGAFEQGHAKFTETGRDTVMFRDLWEMCKPELTPFGVIFPTGREIALHFSTQNGGVSRVLDPDAGFTREVLL